MEETMKISRLLIIITLLAAGSMLPSYAFALAVGQIDTFEDGTTQNWVVGLLGATHPAPPVNVSSGGPAGVDDNYMLLTAVGGSGPGNRLTVINLSQWAGDYTAAGITAIAMDLRNLGLTDLSIRLYLENPMGAPPTDEALTSPVLLPTGGVWTHAEFAIDPLSLTELTGDVNTLLTNVTALRIFHSPTATFPGPAVSAVLGVDNIEAVSVAPIPEPTTMLLLGFGLLGLFGLRKKCKK